MEIESVPELTSKFESQGYKHYEVVNTPSRWFSITRSSLGVDVYRLLDEIGVAGAWTTTGQKPGKPEAYPRVPLNISVPTFR